MNVNRRRGETGAVLEGKPYRLCLTLGALAELESAFSSDNLVDLVERFSGGKLSSADMIRIIGAGLRGGGNDISDDAVAAMKADDGAAGYARIVAELLTATFGAGEEGAEPENPT